MAINVRDAIEYKVKNVWVPKHDDKGHHYFHTPTKTLVDSVTTYLTLLSKPHLLPWSVKIGLEYFIAHIPDWNEYDDEESRAAIFKSAQFAYTGVRDDAGNVGTQVHDILELYVNEWIANGTPRADIRTLIPSDADPRVFAGARSGEILFRQNEVTPIASELLVGSLKHRCAGTLDMLVETKDKKLELWDWKSSNSISQETFAMQCAAYAGFFTEMTNLKISKVKIMLLSKDYAKCAVHDVPHPRQAYCAFKHILAYARWKDNAKEKVSRNLNKITI